MLSRLKWAILGVVVLTLFLASPGRTASVLEPCKYVPKFEVWTRRGSPVRIQYRNCRFAPEETASELALMAPSPDGRKYFGILQETPFNAPMTIGGWIYPPSTSEALTRSDATPSATDTYLAWSHWSVTDKRPHWSPQLNIANGQAEWARSDSWLEQERPEIAWSGTNDISIYYVYAAGNLRLSIWNGNSQNTLSVVDIEKSQIPIDYSWSIHKGSPFQFVEAARTQSGNFRVIYKLYEGDWWIWDQGAPPRRVKLWKSKYQFEWVAISPDGESLYASAQPGSERVICDVGGYCDLDVQSGFKAARIDLKTGRLKWVIRGDATGADEYSAPAVSPDGSLVLMGLPAIQGVPQLALIDTRTGKVLQRISNITGRQRPIFGESGEWFAISRGSGIDFFDIVKTTTH